jgi:hypothetical protein
MANPTESPQVVEPRDVALKMRMDYSHGAMDHSMKIVEEVNSFCAKVKLITFDMDSFLKDAADLISRVFGILNTTIAVWDDKRGLYRYRAFVGFDNETVEAHGKITYGKADLIDETRYPSHEISKHTRLYLSEQHPYAEGEESSFARPALLGMKRRSISDSLEGDYLCFYFRDPDNDILGWIETSGTRMRKLPDTQTIKWIELVACIVGAVILLKE